MNDVIKLHSRFGVGILATFALLAVAILFITSNYVSGELVREAMILYAVAILACMAVALLGSFFALRGIRDPILDVAEATRRIARLRALNDELRVANHNYVETLGFVAHELKNQLASAVLGLYTVKDGYLGEITPLQKKSLESLARSLDGFEEMLRNYLDLSRLEAGALEPRPTYIPLHERVVRPVLEAIDAELQGRQLMVENRIHVGRVVRGDAALLRIVYGNLLSNAVKFGRVGGNILLEEQEDENVVTLSVRNDGEGIPLEQMPLLFRRFSRLENQEQAKVRGTGLGLHICREIVEKHGGKIWADSQMGDWVRFSFTLPKEGART